MGARDPERGAAPVEFVLVGALLTALFLGLVQLGISLHVRNVLVASASEGARYAANADCTPDDGAAYTRRLISGALSPAYARDVTPSIDSAGGRAVLVITVRATLPVIGFYGPNRRLVVRGHAYQEAAQGGGGGCAG